MGRANFILFFLAFFLWACHPAMADLEWITGAVPKNTPEKPGNTSVVKDAPSEDSHAVATGNQDIVVSHLITCTKIVNHYPLDPVNYFYLNKNNQVSYFAYFLIKPSSRIHTAVVECFSPSHMKIAKFEQEYRVGFTDQLLTINEQTYQWFLLEMTLGLDHMHAEYGQSGLPRDTGLYTLHLTVDGQLVGITFFNVMPEPVKGSTPVPAIPPASKTNNTLPMSTPVSRSPISPIPKSIH